MKSEDLMVEYGLNARVFEEGDVGEHMYFIHQGTIQIEKKVDAEFKTLSTLEKGDFFGEMALFDDNVRSARATCIEPCKLLQINAQNFEHLLKSKPEIAVRMIRKYIVRLKENNSRLLEPKVQDKSSHPPVAYLHSIVSKKVYPIPDLPQSTIGRADPVTGIIPEIDLTEEDPNKSIAGSHALIRNRNERLSLSEQVGANETYLNKCRLAPGEDVLLDEGATVKVGSILFRFSKNPNENA